MCGSSQLTFRTRISYLADKKSASYSNTHFWLLLSPLSLPYFFDIFFIGVLLNNRKVYTYSICTRVRRIYNRTIDKVNHSPLPRSIRPTQLKERKKKRLKILDTLLCQINVAKYEIETSWYTLCKSQQNGANRRNFRGKETDWGVGIEGGWGWGFSQKRDRLGVLKN